MCCVVSANIFPSLRSKCSLQILIPPHQIPTHFLFFLFGNAFRSPNCDLEYNQDVCRPSSTLFPFMLWLQGIIFEVAFSLDASCEKYIREISITAPASTENFSDGRGKKASMATTAYFSWQNLTWHLHLCNWINGAELQWIIQNPRQHFPTWGLFFPLHMWKNEDYDNQHSTTLNFTTMAKT